VKRLWLLIFFFIFPLHCLAEDEIPQVTVIDAYLDIHSGAGRGYPIVRVVKQGEWITILKRKHSWFLIETSSGTQGWVKREQLERTLTRTGEQTLIAAPGLGDFSQRDWELAIMVGKLSGARTLEFSTLYYATANLGLEANYSIGLGSFSSTQTWGLGIQHQPFPSWRVAPYVGLGGGNMRIQPKATLVQGERREDSYAHAAIGLRSYLSQRFVLRLQYKEYLLFNDDDNNEEIKEWKIGFAAFF